LLAACNLATLTGDGTNQIDGAKETDVLDRVRSMDLMPRFPNQVQQDQPVRDRTKPAIYAGETERASGSAPAPSNAATPSGDGYDLNFENTPVISVAKVVLGDILGVGYTIDPRVQGTISLSSGRPIPKSDIAFVLENALRLSGVALVRDSVGYRLLPQGDAAGAGAVERTERAEAGYGVSVVPLQYVSAPTILKLIDSFVTKPGVARADVTRNMILIQGSGSERNNAVELVLSFDADWMKGQSVGIFPIENSNPEPIIGELEKILDSGEGGVSQNVVKFQPIGRMNAVLAVTRKPDVLHRVGVWIRRLDNAGTGRSSVHVYSIKYGEARQMAQVLNSILVGGGGSGGVGDNAAGQIAPGSGLASSSSGSSALDRLGAGSGNGQSGTSSGFSSSRSSSGSSAGGTQGGLGATGNAQGGASLVDARSGGLFGSSGGGGPGGGGGAQSAMQGVRITADTVNNTLLIYASQEQYTTIERTIRQVDRPQLQVAIDATIAEVTLNDNLDYGVQFFLTSQNLALKPDSGSLLNTAASAVGTALINRALPGFNFLVGHEASPTVILDALHAVTDVKVLSNPSVVVIDNQVATLQVGDEIPVSTGSANVLTTNNTVVNTIDYRNTGIILRVVPRVNANGNVRLEIEQEISNVSPTSGANTLTPTVSQRKVRSSVAVASGQTVLLAGLISERQSGGRNGLPLLDDIPGAGLLFSQTQRATTRTELIIFIRPQIIRDGVDAHFVAEELRSKLKGSIGAVGLQQPAAPRYR
jgi:general secretion pathway protein D